MTFEVHPDINDAILTDEEWLWQMLLNLLTNACKYTDQGSIRVVVSLQRVRPTENDTTAKISTFNVRSSSVVPLPVVTNVVDTTTLLFEVIDTGMYVFVVTTFLTKHLTLLITVSFSSYAFIGVGIPNEKLGTVFDAFSQVQDGQATGTGLGLFGVRTRAEGLQGTCGARHNTESCTGTGTVMWFAIPYVEDKQSESTFSSMSLDTVPHGRGKIN